MRRILLLIGLLGAGVASVLAQTPDRDFRYAQQAYEAGNFSHAESLFREVVHHDSRRSDAHLMLARLYLETPLRNEGKARRAIRRAVESAPGEVEYMTWQLRIWREIGSDPSWISIPMTRQARRIELATKILKIDPGNVLANEELGLHQYENFRFYHNAINFLDPGITPSLFVLGDTLFTFAPDRYDPITQLNQGRYDFNTLRQALHNLSGMRTLSRQDQAVRAFVEAETFFKETLNAAPENFIAAEYLIRLYLLIGHYDRLTEVAAQLTQTHPDSAAAWRYLGLGHYHRGFLLFAITAFERAFGLMDAETVQAFEDLAPLLSPSNATAYAAAPEAFSAGFWDRRTPRRLAPTNERKLAHYARLVYADLLLRNRDSSEKGWATERGEVLVRYGVPHAWIQYTTPFARTEAWDYGDLKFFFIDDGKTGHYVLYSPTAGGDPRNDFVLRARRAFRTQPERFAYTPPGERLQFGYTPFTFQGNDGQTELYVTLGIPFHPPPAPDVAAVRTGIFLLDSAGHALAQDTATAAFSSALPQGRHGPLAVWQTTRSLSAPPGTFDLSTEFESQSGAFLGYEKRRLTLPNYAADSLQMSDLVLAHTVQEAPAPIPGFLSRGSLSLQPATLHHFPTGAPLHLYFEIYHLLPGADERTAYSVEAVLVARGTPNAFDTSGLGVSARYEGAGISGRETQQLTMETQGLPPGKYVVAVRVQDKHSKQTVEQRHQVRLTPPE